MRSYILINNPKFNEEYFESKIFSSCKTTAFRKFFSISFAYHRNYIDLIFHCYKYENNLTFYYKKQIYYICG